jgi:hypothetical protein
VVFALFNLGPAEVIVLIALVALPLVIWRISSRARANPSAPESAGEWRLEPTSAALTEQEIRAFVGSSADYYLRSWKPALSGRGRASGFNVFAFLGSGLWLGCLKMYRATFILLGIILAEEVLEQVLFLGILQMRTAPRLDGLIGLVVGIVSGMCGNGWYLSHARRVIAEVRSQGLEDDAHLKELARRGGTSLGASLGLLLLFAVAMIAVNLALAALFHQGPFQPAEPALPMIPRRVP